MDFGPTKARLKLSSQKDPKKEYQQKKAKQSSDQHFLKGISFSSGDLPFIFLFIVEGKEMADQEVKKLEECSVSNALGTWVFSVAGALLAIPVGIKRKSLAPLVFFGTTGTMLDIIMGISACEREHAERQMKLLEEAQNSAANDSSSFSETASESQS
ncbi:hypothetical protein PTKIN_Ptkin01aG0030700 [Pterospermum kingtungense]